MTPTALSPPALPDLNAETNPFELVEYLLDQAAYFNLLSVPGAGSGSPVESPSGTRGIRIVENLHRFVITVEDPSVKYGLRAGNVFGEKIGSFEHRWLFTPDRFDAHSGEEPPFTSFDPGASQRFVMLDSRCVFCNGADSFRGFGAGRTLPSMAQGRRLLMAGATGILTQGTGKFAGRTGVYTYAGSLVEGRGFTGSLILRVLDPDGSLRSDRSIEPIRAASFPDPDFTYIAFRNQKKDSSQKTIFRPGPIGSPGILHLEPQIRRYDTDCGYASRHELRAAASVGSVMGDMATDIRFDLLNPGAAGSDQSPIPFTSHDEYKFFTPGGREVGSIGADTIEGRTFRMQLPAPRQQALRFGGFGPIAGTTGAFSGIVGMLAHNSAVGISPHALSTFHVLRIYDPDGKYRLS